MANDSAAGEGVPMYQVTPEAQKAIDLLAAAALDLGYRILQKEDTGQYVAASPVEPPVITHINGYSCPCAAFARDAMCVHYQNTLLAYAYDATELPEIPETSSVPQA